MRVFSLIQLIAAMIVFGTYFYYIEPLVKGNVLLKFLIFVSVFITLSYFSRRIKGHFLKDVK